MSTKVKIANLAIFGKNLNIYSSHSVFLAHIINIKVPINRSQLDVICVQKAKRNSLY